MLIAAVLCLCAAAVCAGAGLRSLTRPVTADPAAQAIRALAPVQLAAAVMLAAGGAVGLTGRGATGWVVLALCTVGALGTLAAGSWQGARYALAQDAAQPADCAGSCAACTLSCHPS